MSAYSAEWATRVYYTFVELCPRAQQIDACIAQTIYELERFKLTPRDIRESLIWILRQKRQPTWAKYKRLIKCHALRHDLLEEVARGIRAAFTEVDVDRKQRQLEWD